MHLKSIRILATVTFATTLLACNYVPDHVPGSTSTSSEGVRGVVTRGPMCPETRDAAPCPDEPFSALFHVFDKAGRRAARFSSDLNGRFSIDLPPGEYEVVPDSSAPLMQPELQREPIRVQKGLFREVVLRFDTGIR